MINDWINEKLWNKNEILELCLWLFNSFLLISLIKLQNYSFWYINIQIFFVLQMAMTVQHMTFYLFISRKETKILFNKHFGSVFRTHDNPTYFSRRLFRFADIYTSKLSNLIDYSINHTFYPRRGVLPHEYKSLFV